ncbi:uncharacterized protein EV420DRAFT_1476961 [Desarmillaria tabescens]|uniref:Uncharacterized protein n=1 Tax=Armillaria tabescens TaxID=1929756 RepID=A0AA39NCR7_ARMTA|nr:uncharacterized protein EV420DRAFT_1476961 [Desarmillaria tabescens]KAK0463252.1 hypothetical protein EV420DRAFT_1476961 [Desarmillaria tabescens]
MIWAAVVIGKDGNYEITQGKVIGLFIGLLIFHGILSPVVTVIIILLAMTGHENMHPASYVFGSAVLVNQTGGWNTGLVFLFGLLSVQWTMTWVFKLTNVASFGLRIHD